MGADRSVRVTGGLFGLGDDAGGDDAAGGEVFGGEGLDFVFFDGLEVADEGAGPVEALGVFVGVAEDVLGPVAVVAAHLFELGKEGLHGAIEFVIGDGAFGDGVSDFGDDFADGVELLGFDFDHGGHVTVAGEGVVGDVVAGGAVGFAEFFANLEAEAVVEDGGEDAEAAGAFDV